MLNVHTRAENIAYGTTGTKLTHFRPNLLKRATAVVERKRDNYLLVLLLLSNKEREERREFFSPLYDTRQHQILL